ncbi:MAG TPA: 3'-5' exonuclease [Candidatus Limnocylindrales bacterium]
MADSLIRNNHPAELHARLVPDTGRAQGEITVVQWQDIDAEAEGIADAVRWYLQVREYKPGDVLVLTSRRRLGYRIRNHIRDAGILVHSFYHEEPLESEMAQRAFCLLTLLGDADDRVALRWWLGAGDPTWRSRAYDRLRLACEQSGRSPRELLDQLADGTLTLAGTDALVDRYRGLRNSLDQLVFLSLADLVDALLPEGDDDCAALREAALLGIDAVTTPGELLERLRSNVTEPETPEQGDYVRVMSLHKSKGLTSKVVLVAGCIEGLIPVRIDSEPPAEQDASMREQRRLFYVAITRCVDALVLSSSRSMPRADTHKLGAIVRLGRTHMATTIPSRFLGELGPGAPAPITGEAWARSRAGWAST